ncbi:unnamed protein product [Caenorhabditis bovis]|uniref:Uncharacterized protein n=1 Tax=Caenorhabditis bovis TaxID=2654633 RepID=A0A8S1EFL9_9PELO|nr:unnamed protein product [Caenorhabditis bovis]
MSHSIKGKRNAPQDVEMSSTQPASIKKRQRSSKASRDVDEPLAKISTVSQKIFPSESCEPINFEVPMDRHCSTDSNLSDELKSSQSTISDSQNVGSLSLGSPQSERIPSDFSSEESSKIKFNIPKKVREDDLIPQIFEQQGVIKFPDLEGCDLEVLGNKLVCAATCGPVFHHEYLDNWVNWAISSKVPWITFLKCLTSFENFRKPIAAVKLANYFRKASTLIVPPNCSDVDAMYKLIDMIIDAKKYLLHLAKGVAMNITKAVIEFNPTEEFPDPVLSILEVFDVMIHDKFCGMMINITNRTDVKEALVKYEAEMITMSTVSEEAKKLLTKLNNEYDNIFKREKFVYRDAARDIYEVRRPGAKTLATIFSFFRILTPVHQCADYFNMITSVMKIPHDVAISEKDVLENIRSIINKNESHSADIFVYKLAAEQKLLEVSHAVAMKNLELMRNVEGKSLAQRLADFNLSFMFLSRLTISLPVVPLKHFVNGEHKKTDAENSLFYIWADKYLRRVKPEVHFEICEEPENPGRDINNVIKLEQMKFRNNQRKREAAKVPEYDGLEELAKLEELDMPFDDNNLPNTSNNMPGSKKSKEMFPTFNNPFPHQSKHEAEAYHRNRGQYISTLGQKVSGTDESAINIQPVEGQMNMITQSGPECVYHTFDPRRITRMKKNSVNQAKRDDEEEHDDAGILYLELLKDGLPYFKINDENINLAIVIDAIPGIAREVERRMGNIQDEEERNKEMITIIGQLRSLPFLIICMAQCIDMRKIGPSRRNFAKSFIAALEHYSNGDKEFVESFISIHYYVIKVPNIADLKIAWFNIQHHGFAEDYSTNLFEHMNRGNRHKDWPTICLQKTARIHCPELMAKFVDQIATLTFLDFNPTLIKMLENLIEYWFSRSSELLTGSSLIDPTGLFPVLQLIVYLLMFASWSFTREWQMMDDDQRSRYRELDRIRLPEIDDPDIHMKYAYLLDNVVSVTFNRFIEFLKEGTQNTLLCAIYQIMNFISGAPESEAKMYLIRKVPRVLIKLMVELNGRFEDFTILEGFCPGFDEDDRLIYLSIMRNRGRI